MKKIFIISLITFILDLIIKLIIKNVLVLQESVCIISNFFKLTYVNNYGAAFSILENNSMFLIAISIIVLLCIIIYIIKNSINNKLEILGYGLLLGGIVGNLFDRICYGYVIDYLDFTILNYDFAIFNLADTAIVIGIIILIIISVWEGRK